MKVMRRKMIALLVAIVALFSLLPQLSLFSNAATHSGICGGNLKWVLDDATGVLTISGTGKMNDFNLWNMPPWQSNAAKIKKLQISDGVTSIGAMAFMDCTSLTAVTMGNGITSIGIDAFSNCSSLTGVTIPNSVTFIEEFAFANCTALTKVTIGNRVTSIGAAAFSYCASLSGVTIPNSVTSIGGSVFIGCSSLTGVTIPNSVTSMGNFVFSDCTALRNVTIGSGVTSIANRAFQRCTSLTGVTIPNSVTSIGDGAFSACTALKNMPMGNGVTSIGGYAFSGCNSLTAVTIPANVSSIGNAAFSDCTNLKRINVSDANPNYASDASGVLFNKSKTRLVQYPAGRGGSYTVPNGVTTIGCEAFSGCFSLTDVILPKSITHIENGAFNNCTALSSVFFAGNAPTMGVSVFYGSNGILPNVTLYYKEGATGWTSPTWNGYPTACKSFADIKENNFFYAPVLWAIEQGITNGTSDATFSPNDPCTRGQAATFLWRAKEKPAPETETSPFSDVSSGTFYYNAVLWAVENGITNGTGDGKFSPDDSCTRGQIVTFLYRTMKDS